MVIEGFGREGFGLRLGIQGFDDSLDTLFAPGSLSSSGDGGLECLEVAN